MNAGISAFNETVPWNSVIKAAVYATDFWKEHLEDECVLQKMGRDRSRSPCGPSSRKPLRMPVGNGGSASQTKKTPVGGEGAPRGNKTQAHTGGQRYLLLMEPS